MSAEAPTLTYIQYGRTGYPMTGLSGWIRSISIELHQIYNKSLVNVIYTLLGPRDPLGIRIQLGPHAVRTPNKRILKLELD